MLASKIFLLVAISYCVYLIRAEDTEDTPIGPKPVEDEESTTGQFNDTDIVPQDLYVIKTIVYEVGILTDASNDTDDLDKTHEQVDVSFFDPSKNGSAIDLSNIPLPIQTNVSGVSVTGLVPGADLASILLPPTGQAPTPVLPKKQVTVTQNISTTNPDKGSEIISNLPKLLGLTKHVSNSSDDKESSVEKKEE